MLQIGPLGFHIWVTRLSMTGITNLAVLWYVSSSLHLFALDSLLRKGLPSCSSQDLKSCLWLYFSGGNEKLARSVLA